MLPLNSLLPVASHLGVWGSCDFFWLCWHVSWCCYCFRTGLGSHVAHGYFSNRDLLSVPANQSKATVIAYNCLFVYWLLVNIFNQLLMYFVCLALMVYRKEKGEIHCILCYWYCLQGSWMMVFKLRLLALRKGIIHPSIIHPTVMCWMSAKC